MKSTKKSQFSRRRASTLAITLVLLAVGSFGLLWMSRTTIDHQRMNKRKYDLSRAFYTAEAGVAQVQQWGNYPATYTPNTQLFTRASVTSGGSGSSGSGSLVSVDITPSVLFPKLSTQLAAGKVTISESQLKSMSVGTFKSDYGTQIGQIESIQLIPSAAGDPVSNFFKVQSVGREANGLKRSILAYMNVNPVLAVKIPAALISFNTAAAFGNARIHWGEAWAKTTFNMLNKSQMGYVVPSASDYDKWAIYRTEGTINFDSTWKVGLTQDLLDVTATQPGLGTTSNNFANAFYQKLPVGTLQWPNLDYQTFKDMAIAHGRYYGTDSSGNVYKNGIKDSAHKVDFLVEFGVSNRDTAPYDLVFIDTTDAKTPSSSNLSTISISGTSLGLKGIFWIGANFDGSGVGSPPSVTGKNPAGTTKTLDKIFAEGVLFAAGTMALSGNAGIYGSAITLKGFTGGGTPDVYYNADLANGLVLDNGNAGSVFKVSLVKEF